MGLLIPINYHSVPAVSLSAACFSNKQYEDTAFQKCFSNLLAVGFERFLVDVYWDAGRSQWSLCPVEVPPSGANVQTSTAGGITPSYPSETGSVARAARELLLPTVLPEAGGATVRRRQDESVSGSTSSPEPSGTSTTDEPSTASSSLVASSTTSAGPSATVISFPMTNGEQLLQIGDYNCTSTITLDLLTAIHEAFLDATSTTTDASITFLILNIHAAASWAAPNNAAQQPSSNQLPSGASLSNVINGNLSDELYTPQKLQTERANLNHSWFDVPSTNFPAKGYFGTPKDSSGDLVTNDGWPTEAYMEFKELHRLILGFGTIDPQMQDYNTSTEGDTIFGQGTLSSFQDVTFSTDGSISSGCLFNPSEESITATTNSSWAIGTYIAVHISACLSLDLGSCSLRRLMV